MPRDIYSVPNQPKPAQILCPIQVVTFTLISNLVTDYIQNWYQSKSDYMDSALDSVSQKELTTGLYYKDFANRLWIPRSKLWCPSPKLFFPSIYLWIKKPRFILPLPRGLSKCWWKFWKCWFDSNPKWLPDKIVKFQHWCHRPRLYRFISAILGLL